MYILSLAPGIGTDPFYFGAARAGVRAIVPRPARVINGEW
jgi:hypothetical protein